MKILLDVLMCLQIKSTFEFYFDCTLHIESSTFKEKLAWDSKLSYFEKKNQIFLVSIFILPNLSLSGCVEFLVAVAETKKKVRGNLKNMHYEIENVSIIQ